MEDQKFCKRCLVKKPITDFKIKNKKTKTRCVLCNICREKTRLASHKYKCEHNSQKYQCKLCGGAGICEHNIQRSKCKLCGGSEICEHNIQRSKCKDCGGSQICEHERQRSQCKDCGGSQICEHNIQKYKCKKCSNPIEVTIRGWISNSRDTDKRHDRYDANNFIDKCFLEGLIEETGEICYYCKRLLQYVVETESLATIERLDNRIGHIKSNCVIACAKCNSKHNNNGLFEYKTETN